MEAYYICTSQGTYNIRIKKTSISRVCTLNNTVDERFEYKIAEHDKKFLEDALHVMYPDSKIELIENEEGLFLLVHFDGEGGKKAEYKMFKSKRKDFSFEEPTPQNHWIWGWCTIV